MKSLLKYVLLSAMATTLSFAHAAEKIFDLNDQYFSETMQDNDKTKAGVYDLPKVTVTTNTWYSNASSYIPRNETGAFVGISIKEPIANWGYSETKSYYVAYRSNNKAISRLTSDNGSTILISVGLNNVLINGKSVDMKMTNNGTIYSISVQKSGDVLLALINGKELLKANISDFGNLAKVETTMAREDSRYYDSLKSLEIYAQ